jgi:hypothetical protein
MQRKPLFVAALLVSMLYSSSAFAGVWLELLYAPCWTGNESNIAQDNGVMGEYKGAIDCFNKDFNGGGARTVLSIKAFQPWEYGSVFLYYDITGPFTSALANVTSNDKGGFFGGTTIAISAKRIAEKVGGQPLNWGFLGDVSFKYEMEHVSKFGMLHYYGLQWDLVVPFLDFATITTVVRNDTVFEGVDFQLGGAWQKSFSIASLDFKFLGFFAWGVFGEGASRNAAFGTKGNWFFITQPQLLWDFGKVIQFTPDKLLVGFEYQLAYNRYLIQDKTENTLQGMIRWNI